MKKDSLEGKVITLYMDGSWELSGRVKLIDDEKLIIESDENLYMVFRSKITCLIVAKEERADSATEARLTAAVPNSSGIRKTGVRTGVTASDLFPMNGMSYDETVMSIPNNLLAPEARAVGDDDLSVFYPGGARIGEDDSNSRVSFGLANDSEE